MSLLSSPSSEYPTGTVLALISNQWKADDEDDDEYEDAESVKYVWLRRESILEDPYGEFLSVVIPTKRSASRNPARRRGNYCPLPGDAVWIPAPAYYPPG